MNRRNRLIGLYPQSAIEMAYSIDDLVEGDILRIAPEIGQYHELWLAINSNDIYKVQDGLSIITVLRKYRDREDMRLHNYKDEWIAA